MVNSYRFLARAGIALVVLGAVAVVGLQVSIVHLPRSRHSSHLVAAHRKIWGRSKQTLVARPARGRSASTLHVLIVGASVSHGLGASTVGHDYASDLARMLQRRTGRTVHELVWSRPGAKVAAADRWSLPRNQRVVIVQLITNDFSHGTPLVLYQQDLTELLDRLHTTSPRASLLCVGAWEPAYAVNRIGVPVRAYDSIERGVCAAHGGGYVSPSPIFQHADWRGPRGRATAFGRGDNFHPNNQGHLHLAQAILGRLEAEHVVPTPAPRAGTLIKNASAHRH